MTTDPAQPPASAPAPTPVDPALPARVLLRNGENGAAIGASFYEQVGGRPFFEKLVTEFYRGVAGDPVLKPMYPEEDLGPAATRLTGAGWPERFRERAQRAKVIQL